MANVFFKFIILFFLWGLTCCFTGPAIAGNTSVVGDNLESEDRYKERLSQQQLEDYYDSIDKEYVGIGVMLQPGEHFPVVFGVYENSPAAVAGVAPNDQIVRVNGMEMRDQPLEQVTRKIRGTEGTKVCLTIRRADAADFDLELVCKNVSTPTVFAELLDDGTGYIRVSKFAIYTGEEFNEALLTLKSRGAVDLIVDLRGNLGGVLAPALQIIGCFVEPGRVATNIVYRDGRRAERFTAGAAIALGMPTVVLVDRNSASASEVLAGALQDYRAAVLVGVSTYGKGTIQDVIQLESGGALKITAAEYFTPNNHAVDGIGLTPDYQVLTSDLQLLVAQGILKPPEQKVLHFTMQDRAQVVVHDTPIAIKPAFLRKNGVLYVPFYFVIEAFGYQAEWQSSDNNVKITGNNAEIFLDIDKRQAIVNGGKPVTFDPLCIEGNTRFIPISNLFLFDMDYYWSGNSLFVERRAVSLE